MKRSAFILALLAFFASCDFVSESGSGNIKTQKRNMGAFTAVEAGSAIDVEISIGALAVEVEADDNILRYVDTHVSGNTLHVGLESGVSLHNTHIKVKISMPELSRVKANASADVKVLDLVKGEGRISFDASSSAGIEAEVEVPEVSAEASSSASITLSGKTRNYKARVSSSGEIKSAGLLSENTDVTANSSGSAEVHASINLTADASSSGSIEYTGGAAVKVNTSSSGSVNKKE